MSQVTSVRIPIRWPDVNVFTFGKSSLYGYDSLNHCLFVHAAIQLDDTTELSYDRLHLSSSPAWPIRQLVLNEDETILALIADKVAYLVRLPPLKNDSHHQSPSKGSRFCPILRVPSPLSSSTAISCSSINFVWLTSIHFAVVYSAPSLSSDCHLYSVRSSKSDKIELLCTISVGAPSKPSSGTPRKNISLNQPSEVIKLDATKRHADDQTFILLFALKTNGEIFLLEIEESQLLHTNEIHEEFQGPLRILPSTFDNYGVTHSQSTLVCLGQSTHPLVVFAPSRSQLHQCMILSPSASQFHLFTIDCLSCPSTEDGQVVASIVADRSAPNRYYLSDLNGNIYAVDIPWLDQVQHGSKELQSTHVQHLINGEDSNNRAKNEVEELGSIQTDNGEQYLAVVVKSQANQEKELILVRSPLLKATDNTAVAASDAKTIEFLDRIRSILACDKSIPLATLRSSTAKLSDSDLKNNLRNFIKSLTEQYINRQEKVRQELANKQRYLDDFHNTQSNEYKQLFGRFQEIQSRLQTMKGQYEQECSRRKLLSSRLGDLLSTIEQSIPVRSEEEIRMQQQLEVYQTQIDVLKEKMPLIQQFMSFNENQSQSDGSSMESMQSFVRDQRSQIDQIKQKLENIQTQ